MSLTHAPQDFRQMPSRTTKFARPRLMDLGISLSVCILIASLGSEIRNHLPPWPQTLLPHQTPPWFYLLFTVPISIFISVAIHEAGHVVVALCLRYRLLMVAVGMVGIANEAGRLRWRLVGANPFAMRGSTFVLTDIARGHRWRELGVLAGGALAQALFLWGLLVIGGAWTTANMNLWLNALLYSTVLLTLGGLCNSLIPMQIGPAATDAHYMLRLLRGGPGVERQLQIQRLTARLFFGKAAYADLDPLALLTILSPADDSRENYAANLLAFVHARENGQPAMAQLNRVLEFVYRHPPMRRATWPFLYAAQYELEHGRGPAVARQWLALVEENEYNPFTLDFAQMILRLEAMILLQEGHLAAAKAKAEQSLALVARRLDRGSCASEQRQLATLLQPMVHVTSRAEPSWPRRQPWRQAQFLFQAVKSYAIIFVICLFFVSASMTG